MQYRSLVVMLAVLASSLPTTAAPKKPSASEILRSRNSYLVATHEAIVATELDGPSVTLAKGKIGAAAYDPRFELVWFVDGSTLRVLDLRAPDTAPAAIAEHLPTAPIVVDSGVSTVHSTDGAPFMQVTLTWQTGDFPQANIEFMNAGMDPDPPEAKLVAVTGTKWIEAQAKRKPVPDPQTVIAADPNPTHKPPKGTACEGDPFDPGERCGESWRFGKTEWKLYVTRKDQGTYYTDYGCVAANKRGVLTTPPAMVPWTAKSSPGPCGTYLFDATGSRWLVRELFGEGQLCSNTGCKPLGGTALGWRSASEIIPH